jgi:hypothetical protein
MRRSALLLAKRGRRLRRGSELLGLPKGDWSSTV